MGILQSFYRFFKCPLKWWNNVTSEKGCLTVKSEYPAHATSLAPVLHVSLWNRDKLIFNALNDWNVQMQMNHRDMAKGLLLNNGCFKQECRNNCAWVSKEIAHNLHFHSIESFVPNNINENPQVKNTTSVSLNVCL